MTTKKVPKDASQIQALASQVLMHKKLYYSGKSIIDDATFDKLEDELRSLAPDHPVLQMVGYPIEGSGKKVKHNPPMLSLAKTYSLEDLATFLRKNTCVVTEKFDGMAMALEYGADGTLVRASTRGSGTLGEDITEHVYHVAAIPKKLDVARFHGKFLVEVRGEVFFPLSEFAPFSEQFDSYRNAVPGTFGRKEVAEAVPVLQVLRFCAYEVILKNQNEEPLDAGTTDKVLHLEENSYLKRLQYLESVGFYSGVEASVTRKVTNEMIESLDSVIAGIFARQRDYQIDGLVFRMDNSVAWEALGITSHHPRGSIAFKQESEVVVTKIIDIEESIGRSGKITFRAKLEPVHLSGAKISYATLHNAAFIEAGGYAPGARVKVTRSGEVIPSIVGLETPADKPFVLPTTCPCGYPALRQGPDLICAEKKNCARKDQEALVHFVHVMEMMGISDKIVMRLREAGLVQEPADFYKLKPEHLMELEGFAQKSAENAIAAIQQKRSVPLGQFLASLGLKRGGTVKCQEVARRYKTIDAVRKATAEDLMQERGWAEKSAEDFVESLKDKSDAIDNLLLYVKAEPDTSAKQIQQNSGHPYFGKTFCITGALSRTRDEYVDMLERVGAKVSDSVSSKTDYLVCNEASSSSKYKKAQQLNIPIINEEKLMEHLG